MGREPGNLDRKEASMSGTNTKVGPFTAGECDVFAEGGEHDGAAVFSSDGQPFCLIDPDTCIGGKSAAVERAKAIAAALNAAEAGR